MRFTPIEKAERALPLLPALIMHGAKAVRARLLEELYVYARPLGETNRAAHALRREVLQTQNRWQTDPFVRPSQDRVRAATACTRCPAGHTVEFYIK